MIPSSQLNVLKNPAARLVSFGVTVVFAVLFLIWWFTDKSDVGVTMRLPDADQIRSGGEVAGLDPAANGKVIAGPGVAGESTGSWPQFRGPDRNGISSENLPIARTFDGGGPRQVWEVECGEGYAGVAIQSGKAYLMDYDGKARQSALRCLSCADGREIWRYAYPLPLKRNHGVTRTVPAVTEKFVVAMDSMCNVICLDAAGGNLQWSIALPREVGSTVPAWYAGQCPLIDDGRVILAPGGTNALLMAVDLQTGKLLWKTPNPRCWRMTHSSVARMSFAGKQMYVYCASGGVVGVSAADGSILWDTDQWKISIANVPMPLALEDGKVFLSGGYNAGSLMLQLKADGETISPTILFRLSPEIFGATQHTPILYNGKIYGVRPNGQFVCLEQDGTVIWASPADSPFGLGPFILANGAFYLLNDSGRLTIAEPSPDKFKLAGRVQILHGMESWAPLALVNGRLFARDFTRLICLDLRAK